jgi:hypothetical protein
LVKGKDRNSLTQCLLIPDKDDALDGVTTFRIVVGRVERQYADRLRLVEKISAAYCTTMQTYGAPSGGILPYAFPIEGPFDGFSKRVIAVDLEK